MMSPMRHKQRRLWPWLLALLIVSIGASFAVVLAAIAWLKTREPAAASAAPSVAASATSSAPIVHSAPTASVGVPVASSIASTPATHVTSHGTTAALPQPTSTSTSTRAPPQTVPIGPPIPPSVGKTPMSGTHVSATSFDGEDCHEIPALGDIKAKATGCFQQFQFQPPVHESAEYILWIDASSNVIRVERMLASPNVPNFDVCMAAAIRTSAMPTTMRSCWARISFGAPCKPDWPGQCLADAGP
jgi:hypothetical protein